MILNFVAAADGTALVKNLITGASYPNVTNVTSFTHEVTSLAALMTTLQMHANNGHALLTGNLQRRLINESRTGACSQDPVEYFILDIDSDSLPYESREQLILHLFNTPVQFVFQASASAKSNDSLRGHYFVLLAKPAAPEQLKRYLKHLNFTALNKYIQLSKSQIALKWPLDIVVNDPNRVVFIAPPVCEHDPVTQRVVMHDYGAEKLIIPDEIPTVDANAKIAKLRDGHALPKREIKGEIVNVSSEEIKITGVKEGENFVYLNINGGDSWGYFFPIDNPDVVSNFKGEPAWRLADINTELHAKYAKPKPFDDPDIQLIDGEIVRKKLDWEEPRTVPMGFIDPYRDIYWQIEYEANTNEITFMASTKSKERMNDFMVSSGGAKIKHPRKGTVEFNPKNPVQWNPKTLYLNTFKPTSLMDIQESSDKMPPYMDKLLRHLTVDQESYDHFINWLAYIYQYRDKTGTSWLFHGMTGTGKGTLFKKILKPIFGQNAMSCLTENLLDGFNGPLERSLIVFVDEFDINDLNNGPKNFNKIKNYITESKLAIRNMHAEWDERSSFVNFIFSSNQRVPIKIDETERRFNIPPRQNERLEDLPDWYDFLDDELEDFCKFLRGYKVNVGQVKRPLRNEAREQMVINSRTSHEEFFIAVANGDLDFFTDYIGTPNDAVLLQRDFETITNRWVNESKEGPVKVQRNDLMVCYRYIVEPNKPITPLKFGAICRNNNLDFVQQKSNGRRLYEIKVNFTPSEIEVEPPKHKNNVIHL